MKTTLFLALLFLAACGTDLEEGKQKVFDDLTSARMAYSDVTDRAEQIRLIPQHPKYKSAIALADSLLLSYNIRWWNAEAASADSKAVAYLYMVKLGHEFNVADTVNAAYTYMEGLDYMRAFGEELMVQEIRRYAEVVGAAITASQSPNMARLAYAAFQRAEQQAHAFGDKRLALLVDSSRIDLTTRLWELPDSVRLAFAPPPSRNNAPFAFGAIGAVFIVLVVGFITFYIRRRSEETEATGTASSASDEPDLRSHTGKLLDAIWALSFAPGQVDRNHHAIVSALSRRPQSQRGTFMYAALTHYGHIEDNDLLKRANAVRSKLRRDFLHNDWEFHPGVLLPREREEWRAWFITMGCSTLPPSEVLHLINVQHPNNLHT